MRCLYKTMIQPREVPSLEYSPQRHIALNPKSKLSEPAHEKFVIIVKFADCFSRQLFRQAEIKNKERSCENPRPSAKGQCDVDAGPFYWP